MIAKDIKPITINTLIVYKPVLTICYTYLFINVKASATAAATKVNIKPHKGNKSIAKRNIASVKAIKDVAIYALPESPVVNTKLINTIAQKLNKKNKPKVSYINTSFIPCAKLNNPVELLTIDVIL